MERYKVCVYQPGYFQPLHYFSRIFNAQAFVLLDDVQLNRKVGQNKAWIKNGADKIALIVPLKGGNRVKLNEAVPVYEDFIEKHLKAIHLSYRKASNYDYWSRVIERILWSSAEYQSNFAWMCYRFTYEILDWLDWDGDIARSSKLGGAELEASQRMAYLTKRMGGNRYVCGREGYEGYLVPAHFEELGIDIEVQDWKCPEYPQQGTGFLSNLSIIDLIMNCSRKKARQVLEDKR